MRQERELGPTAGPPEISGYKIEQEIGRGSSGVVYRARQLSVDRLVALKVMHVDMSINVRSVKRLQREARIAAHLSHPNLISAIDMGHAEGMWWFAMELVVGPSLAERIENGGRLREEDALRMFSQLCDALQHASEKGVVHRDIKPANILLQNGDFPRLADLGLARIEDDPMLTRTGATLGTPHYVSPEQARDPALADVRSDIWSLGATLYHAVCGQPPFFGSSTAEILSSVLYGAIPDPLELRPELSKGLGLVLRKCLSRDPARRYFTPAELGEDLRRVAAHKAPAIKRASLEPLDPTRGENRSLIIGGLTILLLFSVVVVLLWKPWSPGEAREQVGRRPAEAQSWRPIESFESRFDSGRMTLAGAFSELEDLRKRVPASQRTSLEAAADRVNKNLQKQLSAFWNQAQKEVNSQIDAREFASARVLLDQGLPEELESLTGFAPSELPGAIDRTSFERRIQSLRRVLDDRRRSALAGAASTVESFVHRNLLPQVERKRQAGAWNEARALLALNLDELYSRSGCDLRGIDRGELSAALEGLQGVLALKAQELEESWRELDGVLLFGEVRQLAELTAERIRTGAELRPVEFYEAELDRLLERNGIDRELLANAPTRRSLEEFQRRRSELQELSDEVAQAAGLELLQEVEEQALRFYVARDYQGAVDYWQSLQDNPVLAVVKNTLAVRIEGAQELLALQRRAAAAVESLEGEVLSIRQGSITATGKVEVRGDPLERGFRLRETGGSPLVYLLRPVRDVEGTLLDVAAIERLAMGGEDLEADIGLQLQRALFRYHEGDYAGAAELMKTEALQGGALIYYDLGLRVARQLGEKQEIEAIRRSRAEAEVDRLTGSDAEAMDPERRSSEIRQLLRDYRDVLGEETAASLVKTRRGLDSEVLPSTPQDFVRAYRPDEVSFPEFGTVELTFDFNKPAVGTWKPGDWFFTGKGWSCTRRSDLEELDRRPSPSLALVDPLLVDTGTLEVRLRIAQPQGSPPELFAVSVLGFHAVFVGPLGARPPHFLCGTSSLLEVARRARAGEGESFGGIQVGQEEVIVLRLSRNSGKLVASVNGQLVDSGFYAPPNGVGQGSELRIRSIEPVEVLEVTIRGDRR